MSLFAIKNELLHSTPIYLLSSWKQYNGVIIISTKTQLLEDYYHLNFYDIRIRNNMRIVSAKKKNNTRLIDIYI